MTMTLLDRSNTHLICHHIVIFAARCGRKLMRHQDAIRSR